MVKLTNAVFGVKNPRLVKKSTFVDSLRIFVKGGSGGQGYPKIGGVGGNGGDVYVVADQHQTLRKLKKENPSKRFSAQTGGNSSWRYLLGQIGKSVNIRVALGVCVKTEMGRELGELNTHDQKLLVARGGVGGNVNNNFLGQKGEKCMLILDLKLIADVGLVGFPNAGKSTLLSAISRASPKIAEYPFTTLKPQLGIIEYPDFRQISVADLPGLVEGAHANIGLGHQFLKHVERTKLLLFVIDVNGFHLGLKHTYRTGLETILLLNKELELYHPELLKKPALLVLNKVETEQDYVAAKELIERVKGFPDSLKRVDPALKPSQLITFDDIAGISAKYGLAVDSLKNKVRNVLDIHAATETPMDGKIITTTRQLCSQMRERKRNKLV